MVQAYKDKLAAAERSVEDETMKRTFEFVAIFGFVIR